MTEQNSEKINMQQNNNDLECQDRDDTCDNSSQNSQIESD